MSRDINKRFVETFKKNNDLAITFARTEDEDTEIDKVRERIPYAFPWNRRLKEASRVEWSCTDSAEAFDSNLKNQKHLLEKYGWIDTEIFYDLNSYGYRDDEFVESPNSYVAIGECFTYGTGLPAEMTWAKLLEQKLGAKVWNLGLCTTGLDTSFRTLYNWLPIIQPKAVLLLENSTLARETWYIDENNEEWNTCIGFWSELEWQQEICQSKTERYLNRRKNLLAIKELCDMHKVGFKCVSARERNEIGYRDWEENKEIKYALARDLMHPGLYFHEAMVERWTEEI